jgi:hypothetical protein
MRFIIHITTLREPVSFIAKSRSRKEAHAEGLAYIHRWSLTAPNQPCGLRIEESAWMFPDEPALPNPPGGPDESA